MVCEVILQGRYGYWCFVWIADEGVKLYILVGVIDMRIIVVAEMSSEDTQLEL